MTNKATNVSPGLMSVSEIFAKLSEIFKLISEDMANSPDDEQVRKLTELLQPFIKDSRYGNSIGNLIALFMDAYNIPKTNIDLPGLHITIERKNPENISG